MDVAGATKQNEILPDGERRRGLVERFERFTPSDIIPTMPRVVELELEDGTKVYVEAEGFDSEVGFGPEKVRRRGGGLPDEPPQAGRFEEALRQVRPAAQAVIDNFKALSPDETAVEFSLSFDADLKAFVFASKTSATFKVSLTWKADVSG